MKISQGKCVLPAKPINCIVRGTTVRAVYPCWSRLYVCNSSKTSACMKVRVKLWSAATLKRTWTWLTARGTNLFNLTAITAVIQNQLSKTFIAVILDYILALIAAYPEYTYTVHYYTCLPVQFVCITQYLFSILAIIAAYQHSIYGHYTVQSDLFIIVPI